MKIIIDISEEYYRACKSWDKENVAMVEQSIIAYGTPYEERSHGEWEALGFQQGYAFCRCSKCHKTMRLYRDSKNEFCCIADIRKKIVSCMYCGADMRKESD